MKDSLWRPKIPHFLRCPVVQTFSSTKGIILTFSCKIRGGFPTRWEPSPSSCLMPLSTTNFSHTFPISPLQGVLNRIKHPDKRLKDWGFSSSLFLLKAIWIFSLHPHQSCRIHIPQVQLQWRSSKAASFRDNLDLILPESSSLQFQFLILKIQIFQAMTQQTLSPHGFIWV